MNLGKTIHLTGEQAISGLSHIQYDLDDQHHWVGVIQDIEILFYGNDEGLQIERISTAQKVIPVLDVMGKRAQIDVNNHFTNGTDPLDEWTFLSVHFGLLGTEPYDEFCLRFGWGIWDWSTFYIAQYRLDSERPEQSILLYSASKTGIY